MQDVSNLVIPEGEVRTIHDEENRLLWGRLNYNTRYMGNVVQDGVPAPDSPQNVNVVTGTQTISITDGIESHSHIVNLGSTELCKLGAYQDYIYKGVDGWYVHKAIKKVLLDGSTETWYGSIFNNKVRAQLNVPDIFIVKSNNDFVGVSDHFYKSILVFGPNIDEGMFCQFHDTNQVYWCAPSSCTTLGEFRTWLSNNNTLFYYPLATPTDTKITDADLIAQLDAVHQFLTRYGYNGTVSGNLPIIIDRTNL